MNSPGVIPCLPGAPLIGNLVAFRFNRLHLFLQTYRTFGDIGAFRVGPWTVVMLNASEYVRTIMVDAANSVERPPRLRRIFHPLIGNGLLNSENTTHKRQRKMVAPAFQHRRIATYAPLVVEYSERFHRMWPEGREIDIAHEMMRLTLWIVGKTLFDVTVLDDAEVVGEALTTAMHSMIDNATSLLTIPSAWPTPRNQRLRRAIQHLDTLVYQMIQARRQKGSDQGDLLSMLLQAQDEDDGSFMTDQQVRDELMTLVLAGHETTANALAWAWYLLLQHPPLYRRVREEVDHTLRGRSPGVADLPNLPFTLQVLKEAMRLYPPVYIIARSVEHSIQVGPYWLSPGLYVGVSPYVLHRRPDYFPDPQRFDPDRWTREFEQGLPRYAYLPFGAGPHICVGNHFALMEAHLILATLAQQVTFELVSGQQIEPEPLMTLRPRGAISVRVQRRTKC